MSLTLIGLGLGDCKDITLKGFETIQKADYLYLEVYTSSFSVGKKSLEKFYGKEIIEADRNLVEQKGNEILDKSTNYNVVLLVIGDPFCATTHSDIFLRAKKKKININIIHNASILTAISSCGLQMYRFGETISIPFFERNWKPDSFYDKIISNNKSNLHTLCLLDIKFKEQTFENMMKGNNIYEPARYMTINQSILQLIEIEEKRKENVCSKDTKCFGVARLGSDNQLIISGTFEELLTADFGEPLHSLAICAPLLHEIELEFYNLFNLKNII